MKTIKKNFWNDTKRFLEPIKENKIKFLKLNIETIVRSLNPIIHIIFIEKIVFLIENKEIEQFKDIIIIYIIYALIYEVLLFISKRWGWVETIESVKISVQKVYVNKFLRMDSNESEKLGTGKFIAIIEKGIHTRGMLATNLGEELFEIIIILLFTIYMIFNVDIAYGSIFILIYTIIIFIGIYLNNMTIKYRNKRITHANYNTKNLVRIIMSKFEILQSGNEKREISILDEDLNKMIFYNRKLAPYLYLFFRIPRGFISWSKIFIIFFLGINIMEANQSLSVLVGIFGVLTLMENAIDQSIVFYKNFTRDFVFLDKLWNLFDNTPEITGYETGNTFKHKSGKISVKKLNYGYTEDKPVFKDFNLDITGEKVTAIVGLSGSGKSTLVKLISGYIKPDSGDIIIDDQKLSETSLKSYYKDIGYLTQEPSVFDGSVLENLTYAVTHPQPLPGREGRIDEILKLAKCEFIYDLPNGINTEIGEKGIRLSGGQRQRLAIAKIFLKDPKIIILDEPTSALDSFSEEQITKAMNNLFKGRTVIVIAHRLQTVKHADDIIVLEGGEIVERGNHSELVDRDGIYNKMLELQSGF